MMRLAATLVLCLACPGLASSDHAESCDKSTGDCSADETTLIQVTSELHSKHGGKQPDAIKATSSSSKATAKTKNPADQVGAQKEVEGWMWLLSYPIVLVLFGVSVYIFFPQLVSFAGPLEADKYDKGPFETRTPDRLPSSRDSPEPPNSPAGLDFMTPRTDGLATPRTEPATLSNTGVIMQLCSIFQGVGLVNVPVVLALCGWPGLVIVGFVILVKGFVGGLVIECLQQPVSNRSKVIRDFAEIGQTSVGHGLAQIIRTLNVLQLISFASYFMVLVEVSTGPLLADFGLPVPKESGDARLVCVLVVSFIVFPFTFASETNLAWLSFLGNIALMVCPALLLTSGMMLTERAEPMDWVARSQLLDWATGFSLIFGADSGLQVMPHVYEVCAQKDMFFVAFSIAIIITGSVIFFTAYIGYYFYGKHLEACFTLNIGYDLYGKRLPDIAAVTWAINLGLVIKVLLCLPLILVQISDSLNVISESLSIRNKYTEFAHRFLTLAGIVVISLAFGTELIGQLATVGCTVTMLTNICAPVLYYLVMFRSRGLTAKAGMATFVGLLGLIFGVAILCLEMSMPQPSHHGLNYQGPSHAKLFGLPPHRARGSMMMAPYTQALDSEFVSMSMSGR